MGKKMKFEESNKQLNYKNESACNNNKKKLCYNCLALKELMKLSNPGAYFIARIN